MAQFAPSSNEQEFAHAETRRTSPWKLVFRIVRWSTYAAAILTLILILHKTPPPPVETSPQAAARAEQKFEDAEHIGSLPIPQSTLESAVRRLMESPENREKLKLPPQIADLRIENGEVVASYR